MDQLTNLLGALALAVSGSQERAMGAVSGLGASAVAAVVTLATNPGLSVSGLAAIAGLTHSATVRLVQDLERRNLIRRQAGADRRMVGLGLTAHGAALAAQIAAARAAVLSDALQAVAPEDRAALARGVTGMLERLTTSRPVADHICRLCDEAACGGDDCPVERRAVALS